MYEFRDTTVSEQSSANLPSEALKINGIWIEQVVPGYRTLHVSGREMADVEITDLEVGKTDGAIYQGKRYAPRIITVTYQLIAEDNTAFRNAFNKLNSVLDQEEAQLIFKDEEDKFYIGAKEGLGSVPAGVNRVVGEYEMRCSDPFKYSVEELEVVPTLDENKTFSIDYQGTRMAYPKLEVSFKSDNGYVAFANQDGRLLQFGDPGEVDGVQRQRSETLIDETVGSSLANWTTNNTVTVGQWPFIQTGTLKTTNRNGEVCVEPNSYGTGGAYEWHGPGATRVVPNNSAGQKPLNCHFNFSHFMVIDSHLDAGVSQFQMIDTQGKQIASITFYKNTKTNYWGMCHMHVNGKLVKEFKAEYASGNDTNSQSNLATWPAGWSYISKMGSKITFKCGNAFSASFTDSAIANLRVGKVGFFLGGMGTDTIKNNGVRRVSVINHNVNYWSDIPNKFRNGDKLEVNCKSGDIQLSNISEPGLGALGNDWETFALKPGENQIKYFCSDWTQTDPEIKLKYREVYL